MSGRPISPDCSPRVLRSGFTLIDILMAILIMTVGFVGLQMVQIIGFRANALSRELSEATMVGRMKVEQLKAYEAAQAGPTAYPLTSDNVDPRGCPAAGGPLFCTTPTYGTRYTRNWQIDGLGQIFVQVTWQSMDANTHAVELYDAR